MSVTTNGFPVSSKGAMLFWAVDPDGSVFGFADAAAPNFVFDSGEREVFRIIDNGDGTFTFDLKDQIDHNLSLTRPEPAMRRR